MTVVTRFAPSPTGYLHAGNYRTAVFAYLFAQHEKGKFIVRIEDTDAARSKQEYVDNIFETLAWLRLPADETYRQSDHRARHRKLLEQLIGKGTAYVSKEIPQGADDRDKVICFKNPGGAVVFADVIRGEITTDVSDLGDFIIARSFDEPVFHFAVVVDDADEGVTHVIRGADHISNTARQMLIQRALGVPTPHYIHLPLIFGDTHKKLSKRAGTKPLMAYRHMGILPEALLNYIAFLGWNPGDEREYLSREELIEAFDISRVQKGSAVFDEIKLFSVNQHWMRGLSGDDFLARLDVFCLASEAGLRLSSFDTENLRRIVPLLKERARTLEEAREMLSGEFSFFFSAPEPDAKGLLAKEPPDRPGTAKNDLEGLLPLIENLPPDASAEAAKKALMPFADEAEKAGKGGKGAVLWALRYALSGQERSPDPFAIISVIGPDAAIERIKKALVILKK